MTDIPPQRLGQYEIVGLIGEGGMAVVYKAVQTSINRNVAIKAIQARYANATDFIKRFQREAQTIAQLSHAHILKVFDYGQEGTVVYLVTEYLTGGSLADRIGEGGLSLSITSHLLGQIASALDYAHSKGIVHRDLKPQNILFDDSGNAFITDFGIAKILGETTSLTLSGMALGTPTYMSPEQWQGKQVDGRADVYALGILIYEALTGQVPFKSDTPYSMLYMHINEPPPPILLLKPDIPGSVDLVVSKAMAKDPADRFQTAGEMASAFNYALTGKVPPNVNIVSRASVSAAVLKGKSNETINLAPEVTAPESDAPKRRSGLLVIGVLAVLVVIGVLGAIVIGASHNTPSTPIAGVGTSTNNPPTVTSTASNSTLLSTNMPTSPTNETATLLTNVPPTANNATTVTPNNITLTAVTPSLTNLPNSPTLEATNTTASLTNVPTKDTQSTMAMDTAVAIQFANRQTSTAIAIILTETYRPSKTTVPSATPTSSFTPTIPTATPTSSFTPTVPSATPTSSFTPTVPSATPTSSFTPTIPTATPTSSFTPTVPSATPTSSFTPTVPTATPTIPTDTPTSSFTPTVPSATPTSSFTPTVPTNTPTSSPSTTLTNTPVSAIGTVKSDGFVRVGPGVNYNSAGQVKKNDKLPVIAKTGMTGTNLWFLIIFQKNKVDTLAWIRSDNITLIPANPTTIATAATGTIPPSPIPSPTPIPPTPTPTLVVTISPYGGLSLPHDPFVNRELASEQAGQQVTRTTSIVLSIIFLSLLGLIFYFGRDKRKKSLTPTQTGKTPQLAE